MADNECKIVRMKSSDEQIFEVEEAVALKSQTIKDMIGEIGNESIVPLFNVSAKTLAKVIQYCRYHVAAETSTPAVKKWDEDFFKVSQDELYHLIMAANYLNIKDLLDLGCQTVANMIKGKSPEEIRRTFNIKNDFTEEELEEVRCENAWASE